MLKKPRILLFEDDFASMRDLKEFLEDELGWQVELSAAEDLLAQIGHERFDLLVVDAMIHPTSLDAAGEEVHNVHYEGVNWRRTGLEFVRRLQRGEYISQAGRGTPPDVPVLILSAVASYSVEEDLHQEITVQGYVEKPFRLGELIEQMRALVER
jgi:CheY-like chemotaxis protein